MTITANTSVPRAREIERVVVDRITETVAQNVTFTLETNRYGRPVLKANGEKILVITSKGHLLRFRGLTEDAGVRRLPDGRIAIKKATANS